MKDYTLACGNTADITVIDPECVWTVDKNKFKSKARNTPFDGMKVTGRPVMTIVGGNIVYRGE